MRLNVVCFHLCQGEFDLKLDIVDKGSVLAHPKTMPTFQQYVVDRWFFAFDHFLQSSLRQIGDKAVMTMLCKKFITWSYRSLTGFGSLTQCHINAFKW